MNRALLKNTGIALAACAALIAVLYFWVDRPVDLAARGLRDTALFQAATALSLIADHGLFNVLLSVGLAAGGALALARPMTPGLRLFLYCCLAVAVTMLLGETLKWLLARYRPEKLFSDGLYGFSFLSDKGSRHSFPSGHTFRIFSAMTALALAWPRWRAPALVLAVLVGVSRVVVTRHYPGDIVAGAFLGVTCALWMWHIMRPDRPRPVAAAPPPGC